MIQTCDSNNSWRKCKWWYYNTSLYSSEVLTHHHRIFFIQMLRNILAAATHSYVTSVVSGPAALLLYVAAGAKGFPVSYESPSDRSNTIYAKSRTLPWLHGLSFFFPSFSEPCGEVPVAFGSAPSQTFHNQRSSWAATQLQFPLRTDRTTYLIIYITNYVFKKCREVKCLRASSGPCLHSTSSSS